MTSTVRLDFKSSLKSLLANESDSLAINELSVSEIQQIADALKLNTSLKTLDMGYTKENDTEEEEIMNSSPLGVKGAEYIGRAIMVNSTLNKLGASHNEIRDEGAQQLAEALMVNSELTALDLESNNISEIGAKHIAKAMKANTSIVCLNLSNNLMSDRGAEYIFAGLRKNKSNSLVELNLSQNIIGEVGAEYIGAALKSNDTLRVLKMSDNEVLAAGAGHLAEALEVNNSIVTLELGNNNIGDDGATYMADALNVNNTIINLDLSRNNVGDIGGNHLAEALKVNKTLGWLNLCKNGITNDGAKHFIQALKENTSLIVLDLHKNEIISGNVLASKEAELKKNFKRNQEEFLDALNGHKAAPWNRSRISIVGKGSAGKTATVRSLLGETFNPYRDSTIGVSISECLATHKTTNWKSKSNPWTKTTLNGDGSGDYTNEYAYRFATRIMLNIPNTREESLAVEGIENVDELKKQSLSKLASVPEIVRKISKKFSPGKVIPSPLPADDEKQFVREFNEKLVVKAKKDAESLALSVWDFGGQKVFYPMHHLFFTRYGTYAVVFDIRELLDIDKKMDALSYLSFWLQSIKLHAPTAPVLLVGNFAAEVNDERKSITQIDSILREELVKDKFPQLVLNDDEEEELIYFPIDNKEYLGIEKLRMKIENAVRHDASVFEEVPVRWMILLDQILSKRKESNYISLSTINKMANSIGIRKAQEIEDALQLFHERGMMIHLQATEALKDYVVLRPQWLCDGLSKIIRDRDLHKFSANEFEAAGLKEDLQMTFKNALSTQQYMEYVWNGEHVDFFLDFMRRTMLLSDWNFLSEHYFLVPSLLVERFPEANHHGLKCVFDFSNHFLPIGVFQRLISLCSAYRSQNKGDSNVRKSGIPILCENAISMELKPGFKIRLHKSEEKQSIIMYVEDYQQAPKSLFVILSMLGKVSHNAMGNGLSWETRLEDPDSGELVGYREAREKLMSPWFDIKNVQKTAVLDAELKTFLKSID
eukprot:CAMPEP_0204862744 /NCGR_PEP_ID=MMETSP1348-20121228/2781_1 /ASSEMBLY_ACC=CAM_ASM_000700 /TAXON_ID=215587 /ORGANISM="Aplanochytrium stocchinoi, Strain GSBS06" /LENGTH=995 /DNA_ID=CAMNT_0052012841 /DNA_START=266 /DNA_END=3253 /DNA_ORIENTATION=+